MLSLKFACKRWYVFCSESDDSSSRGGNCSDLRYCLSCLLPLQVIKLLIDFAVSESYREKETANIQVPCVTQVTYENCNWSSSVVKCHTSTVAPVLLTILHYHFLLKNYNINKSVNIYILKHLQDSRYLNCAFFYLITPEVSLREQKCSKKVFSLKLIFSSLHTYVEKHNARL